MVSNQQTFALYTCVYFTSLPFKKSTATNASLTSGPGRVISDALHSQLAMLSALTALVKIEDFCAAPHNFALMLVNMSNTARLQVKAMEVLLVVVQHKMSVELFSVVLQALSQVDVHTMPTDLEESLQFQRTYAAVLHTLLSQHVHYVLDSLSPFYTMPGAVATLSTYVNKMLTVLQQSPSLRLAGDVIKEWVKIYRDKMVSHSPIFRDVAMTVLNGKVSICKALDSLFPPHNTNKLLIHTN